MPIEAKLTFANRVVLSRSPVKPGKEYLWAADKAGRFSNRDYKTTRVSILGNDSVSLLIEWDYERENREKAGQPVPANILKGSEVNGLKIPHLVPGFRYVLSWKP